MGEEGRDCAHLKSTGSPTRVFGSHRVTDQFQHKLSAFFFFLSFSRTHFIAKDVLDLLVILPPRGAPRPVLCVAGDGTRGFVYARPACYPPSHTPQPQPNPSLLVFHWPLRLEAWRGRDSHTTGLLTFNLLEPAPSSTPSSSQ